MSIEAIIVIYVVIVIILFIIFLKKIIKYMKAGKELDKLKYKINELDYFTEIPDEKNATPARAAYLYYFDTSKLTFEYIKSNIFAATILQLAFKKYIALEPINKRNIKIHITNSENTQDLTIEEEIIYKFIAKNCEQETDSIDTDTLKKYAKKNYDAFYKVMEGVCNATQKKAEENEEIHFNENKLSKKWANKCDMYLVALLFATIIGIATIVALPVVLELAICAMLCFNNSKKINVLSEKATEEAYKWKGLKNYMIDFSSLKEKKVPDLIVWEKYLVYATVFDLSQEVLGQLVKVYPQMRKDEYYNAGGYTYLHIASRSSISDIESMSKSFKNIYQTASLYGAQLANSDKRGFPLRCPGVADETAEKIDLLKEYKEFKMFTEIILLIILIALNAFFAATEIAFISLNDTKIELEAKEGNKKAKSIRNMLVNPSKFLATIQIGITLAGFLSSAFASEAFASELAPIFYALIPSISLKTWNSISIVIITLILSYFTLVFGELVPKRVAMKYSEKMAYASIGIIKAIAIITAPFVRLLTFSTNIISKILGVSENDEETVTEEEIRMMVDVGEEKGAIDAEEKEMINNIFEFNDKAVTEIMVPRKDVFALDMNLSISKVIEEITEDFRYSRIPVYDETIDNIKGIVYVKDILISTKNKNVKIKNLIKDAYFVPETKPVNELFEELRKNRKQIAIVLDEYGGTSGIVTMEDILEEIVGEIYDEYDEVENKYEKLDENTFIIAGSMSIYDVEKILDVEITEGDYDTLSGYLLEQLGRIPGEKEKPIIETKDLIFKIEKVSEKRIIKVKVCKVQTKEEEKE